MIQRWLDRFCYKHSRFGIPNLMLVVVIGNALVWLLDQFSPGFSLSSALSFVPYYILRGEVWRLVTFVFVPTTNKVLLLAISLYFYYWIGSVLERQWGTTKFTVFYLLGLVLNIIAGFILYLVLPYPVATVSMHYVNLSLFFAFATLYGDMQVLLFFVIPIKVKWLAWVDAALFAFDIILALAKIPSLGLLALVGVVAPIVAILNYLIFFWDDLMATMGRVKRQTAHRTSRQTVNFKQATKHAQQTKGYIHKCAVCGKTDTDYPDEEFRYCSKCNGYYCYCSEHIHNHVHIQ
ncbi:rhomboid family intramembrane serine protease [uncultured Flavonifractor sp.]|uniref:rhomboid family intramembrane serine protease n=1 Tax=uncultured Flavonifractor sp. TaxID=1193534 RepID=UPI00342BCFEA